ncbi:MAG: 4-hydroxyphenylpyruvate dioxygenase, partial [Sediminibacterium sp.]|nr:4-hydroxyphenylpyruvate dioxygenase [Sediminibacterium sp.]
MKIITRVGNLILNKSKTMEQKNIEQDFLPLLGTDYIELYVG